MDLEKIQRYLQTYLDSVITPKFLEEPNDDGIESFKVYDVLKGTYEPPIIHIFLDINPTRLHRFSPETKSKLKKVENDVYDFMKMFGFDYRMKIHLDKRPTFSQSKEYSKTL